MILPSNPEHLNPLPKPSVTTGWEQRTGDTGTYLTDGHALVRRDALTPATVRLLTNPKRIWPDDILPKPQAETVDRLVSETFAACASIKPRRIMFLGCAANDAFLVVDGCQVKCNAAKLAYLVTITQADELWRSGWQANSPILLYRGEQFVGLLAPLRS